MDDYDDYPDSQPPRDAVIDEALPHVFQIFEDAPDRVFYSTQIETQLERQFFHWITNKALLELANGGYIQRMPTVVQEKTVHFYAHNRHRYSRRDQQRLKALLERIFDSEFTQAVGRQAEMMFDSALSRSGFMMTSERNVRAWDGEVWTKTNHNLDRICTRDGVAYGIEIKNTQNYIPRNELLTKLDLCAHLGLTPLFIMRFAPKSYMFEIYKRKGFGLLFEDQIYPFGHSALLKEVRDSLGLKVQSPRDIPDGHMLRLVNFHRKRHG